MIDIYVCEDANEQRKIITSYIKAAILIQEYDMKLKVSTDNPEVVIEELKKSKNTGLYCENRHAIQPVFAIPRKGMHEQFYELGGRKESPA